MSRFANIVILFIIASPILLPLHYVISFFKNWDHDMYRSGRITAKNQLQITLGEPFGDKLCSQKLCLNCLKYSLAFFF